MTTKNKFAWIDDVSRPNEVFNFGSGNPPSSFAPGAAHWLADASSPYDSLLLILRTVYAQTLTKLPGYRMWLLAGTSAWQPDSRIVRHRGLWGALKARGVDFPNASRESESMLKTDGKLKFFGAAHITDLTLTSVAKVLLEERCTYLLAMPSHALIDDLVEMGWSGGFRDDANLLDCVNRKGGVIFSKVGEFDDIERGLVAVANPRVLKILAS